MYLSKVRRDQILSRKGSQKRPNFNRAMLGNFRIGFESIFKSSMHSTLPLRFLPLFFGSHAENEITVDFWKSNK